MYWKRGVEGRIGGSFAPFRVTMCCSSAIVMRVTVTFSNSSKFVIHEKEITIRSIFESAYCYMLLGWDTRTHVRQRHELVKCGRAGLPLSVQ